LKLLSRKEELLLLAIVKLRDNAYGVSIRDQLARTTKRHWSLGAIYDVLDRLTRKEFVKVTLSGPVPERGGKCKRLYRVSKRGYKALEEVRIISKTMWSELSAAIPGIENL
jgi:DNA-binding PadR family transcriptional regulator